MFTSAEGDDGAAPGAAPVVVGMGSLFRQLDDLNVRMQRLIDIELSQIPNGDSLAMGVAVTDNPTMINSVYLLPDGSRWYGPWISVDIISQGPGGVYYLINNQLGRHEYASIPPNTIKVVNLRTPRLNSLTLYCATGQTATVTLIFQR